MDAVLMCRNHAKHDHAGVRRRWVSNDVAEVLIICQKNATPAYRQPQEIFVRRIDWSDLFESRHRVPMRA